MKIGFVGIGKLGLPCAVAIAAKGHSVCCYDIDPAQCTKEPRPYKETAEDGISPFNPLLAKSNITFGSLREVVASSDIIFLAVQTPHDKEYEGVTRIPQQRKDFDYSHLEKAIQSLAKEITTDTIVVVISTVLPGTIRERVLPHISAHMKLCYNPFFIAMGTTIRDFLHPEFILFGVHDQKAAKTMESFYKTITDAPFFKTTIENAELIKVAYNTYIGMKIAFANTMMELCHHTKNTNVDEVTRALALANTRIMSDKYLYGGMGDGGGCHPRDNIALSFLSQKLGLRYDWFESIMLAREKQTEFLVELMQEFALPKAILGYSFKAESNITTGSPALLLESILKESGETVFLHDPLVEERKIDPRELGARVFLIGTRHQTFQEYRFAHGSVIIDPWGYLNVQQNGVTYIPVGRKSYLETLIIEQSDDPLENTEHTEQGALKTM